MTKPMWEIWEEGYAATGERGEARLLGKEQAETFREACLAHFAKDAVKRARDLGAIAYKNAGARKPQMDVSKVIQETRCIGDFDPDELALWGCRWFPTEAEARRRFG